MKSLAPLVACLLTACAAAPNPCPASSARSARDHHGKSGEHNPHHHRAPQEGDVGHEQLVHDFHEGPAMWRKRLESPERAASQKPEEVVAALALQDGMTVADIGAGTGYFLQHLSAAVGPKGRVLAIDIEPQFVRFLKQRARDEKLTNVEARLALGDDPLLADGSVDRILIVNTWHHIPARKAYAKRLVAALEPQGSVWVIDFNQTTSAGPPKHHRLLPSVVVSELEAAGFRVRVDDAMLVDQYVVVGVRP